MKLAKVSLARAMAVGRTHMAEVIADAETEVYADLDSRTIRIGNQLIPFEAVNSMTKAEASETCPECQKKFDNLQGLGAHRFKAHGIKGANSND